MTTRRDEDPAAGRPDYSQWTPDSEDADEPQPLPPAPGATRAERRRAQEAAEAAAGRPFAEAFTESPSGTSWPRPTFDPPPRAAERPSADGPPTDAYGVRIDGYAGATDATGAGKPPAGLLPRPRDGREPASGDPRLDDPRPDGARPGDARPGEPRLDGTRPGPGEPRLDGARLDGARPGDSARWEAGRGALVAGDAGPAGPGAFNPGDTGTWRVRDVVPGADGGRRTTVILRYLLGLLAVDHVRSLTRWAFALPLVGLVLLVVRPRWIGLAVIVLGLLLVLGRIVAVRMISRRTLPRRYRPVEDELRAAVEAGKANLRGELRRVGMPSSALALTRSVVRLGSSDSRRTARSRLRDIEIDRVLPRAQLDRALRVLDEAPTPR